jgi:hypothetical protein
VRPDLAYSLATNKLNVNFEKKAAAKKIKNICSSRQHFLYTEIRKPIKMVKAFILDTAFKTTTK